MLGTPGRGEESKLPILVWELLPRADKEWDEWAIPVIAAQGIPPKLAHLPKIEQEFDIWRTRFVWPCAPLKVGGPQWY
eukprot:752390-Pyramimonas_sp.AAC.1